MYPFTREQLKMEQKNWLYLITRKYSICYRKRKSSSGRPAGGTTSAGLAFISSYEMKYSYYVSFKK